MNEFTFARATKEAAKARVALDGPSGSGKTYTGLITARALAEGGKIALIDTERGSASKYASLFEFDTLQMHTFDPRDLVKALAAAGAAGYPVIVVDSLSHFWAGTGGMLEQADNAGKRYGGNTFAGWKDARPMERAMIDALLAYPGHVIVTMRTKSEWVIEDNEKGKKTPRKVGTKPEQREGIEYEFDIVGDLDTENTLMVSKSRCPDLTKAVIREPDDTFGKTILAWLTDGAVPAGPSVGDYVITALDPSTTFDEFRSLYSEVEHRNLLGAAVQDESGEPTTLGELLLAKGKAAQTTAAAVDPPPANVNPDTGEVTDGEVVRPAQIKRMAMLMHDQGITDRNDALAYVAAVIGHEVGSRNELTKAEASQVIASLEADVVAQ